MNSNTAHPARPRLLLACAVLLLAGCGSGGVPSGTLNERNGTDALPKTSAESRAPLGSYVAPEPAGYPASWTILENISYLSAYDETLRAPAWVVYRLGGTAHEAGPRLRNFPTDTRSTSRVTEDDFPPGYDRGHMAPSEGIGRYYSQAGQDETFLMTNMVPQRPGLNRGPWKSVETAEYVRWAPQHEIWVVCGPVYTDAEGQAIIPRQRYGAKQVSIPEACFKIIATQNEAGEIKTLAFIMPQQDAAGHSPAGFLRSIREIERRTGLDFFSRLPKATQDAIETHAATGLWP